MRISSATSARGAVGLHVPAQRSLRTKDATMPADLETDHGMPLTLGTTDPIFMFMDAPVDADDLLISRNTTDGYEGRDRHRVTEWQRWHRVGTEWRRSGGKLLMQDVRRQFSHLRTKDDRGGSADDWFRSYIDSIEFKADTNESVVVVVVVEPSTD